MFERYNQAKADCQQDTRGIKKTLPKSFDFLGVFGVLVANALVSKPFYGYRTVIE